MEPIPYPPTLAPAPVPRVTPRPAPGAFFPAPTVPHLIEPDPDKVLDARIPLRYHLRSQRPLPPLTERIPHHIASELPTNPTYPHALPGTSSCYVTETRLMLAVKATCTASAANSVTDKVTGKYLKYRNLIRGLNKDVWTRSLTNDLGRLAQGVGTCMPTGTNTVFSCGAAIYLLGARSRTLALSRVSGPTILKRIAYASPLAVTNWTSPVSPPPTELA